MQKFRCEKCGHRIAIQPRHLGMLVTCPECGNLTHPLAEKIIERGPTTAPPPAPAVKAEPSRSCENCGRAIGKLESPELWQRSVVCTACYRALADSPSQAVLTRERQSTLIEPKAASSAITVSKKSRRQVGKVRRASAPAAIPRLSFRVPRGPLRIILWLIVIALAAWFVLNVVRFISVLVNVAIVGFLLLATLWVIYQGGMNEAGENSDTADGDTDAGD